MTTRVTRSAVLAIIRERFPTSSFASPDIAEALGASDHAVRCVVGWLLAAGVLERAGRERCSNGSKFYRATYRWTGREEVHRVPRSKPERRAARLAAETADKSTAAAWLCRKW